jgi:hypothetical protein
MGDQGWFYTGSQQYPNEIRQKVWICTVGGRSASYWEEQAVAIDGNLVVAGTVNMDRLVAGKVNGEGSVEIGSAGIRVMDGSNTIRIKIGNLDILDDRKDLEPI